VNTTAGSGGNEAPRQRFSFPERSKAACSYRPGPCTGGGRGCWWASVCTSITSPAGEGFPQWCVLMSSGGIGTTVLDIWATTASWNRSPSMRASGGNHLLLGGEVLVRRVVFCDAVGIFCRKRARKTV
jgi:hypothetical protein